MAAWKLYLSDPLETLLQLDLTSDDAQEALSAMLVWVARSGVPLSHVADHAADREQLLRDHLVISTRVRRWPLSDELALMQMTSHACDFFVPAVGACSSCGGATLWQRVLSSCRQNVSGGWMILAACGAVLLHYFRPFRKRVC